MREYRWTENNWVAPTVLSQQLPLTNYTNKLSLGFPHITKRISAVLNPNSIKALTQVKKITLHPSGIPLSSHRSTDQPPRIPVEWQPAIFVRFAVKNIEHTFSHFNSRAINRAPLPQLDAVMSRSEGTP